MDWALYKYFIIIIIIIIISEISKSKQKRWLVNFSSSLSRYTACRALTGRDGRRKKLYGPLKETVVY